MSINYQKRLKTEAGAKKIVYKLMQHPIALLDTGTGGGKTFMAIRTCGAWKPQAHLIIFTTKKSVDSKSWANSIDSYNQNVNKAQLTYDIFNYEALRNKKDEQIKYLKSLLTKNINDVFIIADEAHRIKNATSNTFRMVKRFSQLPINRGLICLTATPTSNSLLDYASYLILAGYYTSQTNFYKQHVIHYDDHFQPITKDFQGNIRNDWLKNPQQIINQVNSIQIKIDTSSLLPKTVFKTVEFSYPKETQHQYRQIIKDLKNGVYESKQTALQAQNKFVAEHCQQRIKTVCQIIQAPNRHPGPALIFYNYNADLESLKKYLPQKLPEYQIFEANGQHSLDPDLDYPDNTLILCQYKAIGEAVNIEWSHLTIFYAPTTSWQDYRQAKGRNIRAYQKGTTFQCRFVVKKTINEHYWYDLLDKKKAFTNQMENYFLSLNE